MGIHYAWQIVSCSPARTVNGMPCVRTGPLLVLTRVWMDWPGMVLFIWNTWGASRGLDFRMRGLLAGCP